MVGVLLPLVGWPARYCEPFVGGGSLLIAYAQQNPKAELWANDADPHVAAFWRVLVGFQSRFDELCERVLATPATVTAFKQVQTMDATTLVDRAFRLLYLSKTAYSGMVNASPIGGWKQTGNWKVDCQYNPVNIIARCAAVRALLTDRISVTDWAVPAMLPDTARWMLYLDPPYYEQSQGTYPVMMTVAEHEELATRLRQRSSWVLSYRDCPEIRALYTGCPIKRVVHRHSMTSAYRRKETWKDGAEVVICSPSE